MIAVLGAWYQLIAAIMAPILAVTTTWLWRQLDQADHDITRLRARPAQVGRTCQEMHACVALLTGDDPDRGC